MNTVEENKRLKEGWVTADSENIPREGQIVYIKRRSGQIYIGHRLNKPFSTNKDHSQECYWYANPCDEFKATGTDEIHFSYHFSDQTVTHWMPLPNKPI